MEEEKLQAVKPFSYREGKRRLRTIRWMLFAIAAVQLLVTVVMTILDSFFVVPLPFYLQILLVELLAYLVPLVLYTGSNRLLSLREARVRLGLKRCPPRFWGAVLLLGLGCQFVMILLNLPANLLFPPERAWVPTSGGALLAALLVEALVPAICEEYLFRGIVYGVMKAFNPKAAAIFTTLMFAFLHGSPTGFLGYLFLGIISLYILRRTESLYACMVFHFVNNVTALVLSYGSAVLMSVPAGTLALFVLGPVLFALGAYILKRQTAPLAQGCPMRTMELLGQSVMSLPTVLCMLCMIGILILG